MKHEEALQMAVCTYIKLQYPNTIFTSESSGLKLTIGQSVKAKKMRSSDKLPDLWILCPNKHYHGLFIELKTDPIYKKDMATFKTDHIKSQAKTIKRLCDLGYYAEFAIGFKEAKALIDIYMNDN
tara:strand:- start:1727 stop:2101 length:375 start_codon:yes stop_codon:yes gene_type:complete